MSAIQVVEASKRFGSKLAVDQVSFDAAEGEIVGLLGANGAGKTTAMKMLLGLEEPTDGQLTLLGQPASDVDRRHLGYVPQGLGLYSELTVRENLQFVASSYGVEVPDLSAAGLAEIADLQIAALSLGIRRRVAFLAAQCHQPDVLILDEPTSGVGPLGRARLWETIHGAADAGAAVLVSTHYMDEAEECDRIVMLADGREVMSGTVDEALEGVEVVTVGDLTAEMTSAVESSGGTPLFSGEEWRIVGMSMEEVHRVLGKDARAQRAPANFEEIFISIAR